MRPFLNMTVLDSSTSADEAMALTVANTIAVDKNNQANMAERMGRFDEAIALHREALAMKIAAYSEASVQAGISFNGLGEALLAAGQLPEADTMLVKALKVREEKAHGGLGLGPGLDAAATRDNVARLREAQGDFEEARLVRLKGAQKNEILCGNYHCPTNAMYPLSKLSACGACRSVWYCSKNCQARDWRDRHKPLCKAHSAAASTAAPAAGPAATEQPSSTG